MPPLFRISSQQLNTGGAGRPLSPTLIDPSPARSLGSISLPVNAGDTRVTPRAVPKYVENNFLNEAAKFSSVWANAAFNFQMKEDEIIATNAQSQFEREAQTILVGDGETPGYASTVGLESRDKYQEAVDALTTSQSAILDSLSPSARQRAVLKMQNTYNNALAKFSNHRAQQLEQARENALITEMQVIQKELDIDPDRGWALTVEHAKKFRDPIQQTKVLTSTFNLAVEKVGNNILWRGGTHQQASKAMIDFFNRHRADVPPEGEEAVRSALLQNIQILKRQEEATREKNRKIAQETAEYQGGTRVYGILQGGEAGMLELDDYRNEIFSLYPEDPDKAQQVLTDNYQTALQAITVSQGYEAAYQVWENLKKTVREGNYIGTPELLSDLEVYVNGPLYNVSQNQDRLQQNQDKRNIYIQLRNAQTPEEVKSIQSRIESDPTLQEGSLIFLSNVSDGMLKDMNREVEKATKDRWHSNYLVLKSRAQRGINPTFETEVWTLLGSGELGPKEAEKLLNISQSVYSDNVKAGYNHLRTNLITIAKTNELYYDPQTREVGFWSMLDEDQQEDVRQRLGGLSKDSRIIQQLVVQSLMDEAEAWVKENEGKNYNDWFVQYMSQQPGVAQTFWGGIITRMKQVLTLDFTGLQTPLPAYGTTEEGEQRAEYERVERPPSGESPPGTTGLVTGTRDIPNIPTETFRGDDTTSPPDEGRPANVQEYAIRSVPLEYRERYQGRLTDWLLALDMLRQQRRNIDKFSDSQINAWVDQVLRTQDFVDYKIQKRREYR